MDTIVCVDGGLKHAVQLSLNPAILIGDMDSVKIPHRHCLSNETQVVTYPVEKDETDLELALKWVAGNNFGKALIVGISGGRLDHTLANIQLLARPDWPFQPCFWDSGQFAWIIKNGQGIDLDGYRGYTMSLIPQSNRVESVNCIGTKYTLHSAQLKSGSTRAISNIIVQNTARISVGEGVLLIIITGPELV